MWKDLVGDRTVKWQINLNVNKHEIAHMRKNNSNYIYSMMVNYLLPFTEEMVKFLDRVI